MKTVMRRRRLRQRAFCGSQNSRGGDSAPTDGSTLESMKQYMQYFEESVASSKSADEVREEMKSRYPNLGLETLVYSGSKGRFP